MPIVKRATEDVALVRKFARIVITLTGDSVSVHTQNNPLLNVIAVVGPTVHDSVPIQEAVLCEIGLVRARPYQRAARWWRKRSKSAQKRTWEIRARVNAFSLSDHQYRIVAPVVFQLLVDWMKSVTSRWKDIYAHLNTNRAYINRRGRHEFGSYMVNWPRGPKISVSTTDSLLCADLFQAEISDPFWEDQLEGLGAIVDMTLKPLDQGYREPWQATKQAQRARELIEARLSTIPGYILEKLQYADVPKGWSLSPFQTNDRRALRRERRASLIREVLGDVYHWQQEIANTALPGTKERINELMVRDISSLRRREKGSHVVFMLLPAPRHRAPRRRI